VPFADLESRVDFRILTPTQPGVTLGGSRLGAPCGRDRDGFVELVYEYRGESFVLHETRAPTGPIKVDLKEYGRSSWRVVTIDGTDCAVQVLDGSVTVAAFQRDGTRVDVTVGAKGSPMRPMSLAEFEELVRHIG